MAAVASVIQANIGSWHVTLGQVIVYSPETQKGARKEKEWPYLSFRGTWQRSINGMDAT